MRTIQAFKLHKTSSVGNSGENDGALDAHMELSSYFLLSNHRKNIKKEIMYQLPIWSHKPSNCQEGEWYIEEIKNGMVVSKHILNVPVTTFGRTPVQLLPNTNDDPKIDYKSIITAHESECFLKCFRCKF